MKNINVNSFKVFGSPAFSAGSLFMYEKVDAIINISNAIKASGIKVKGVPLQQIIKALTVGVLNDKKSVKEIHEDIQANGTAKYIGNELDAASMRNPARAIEKLGEEKGKKLYETIIASFQEKLGFDFSQLNTDFSSSFFQGNNCKLAKHGFSRDHRPDKPQIKIGIIQCGKQLIPFNYCIDEGNLLDLKEFEPTFSAVEKKVPKGALFVFDKGANDTKNKALVASAGHYYLTAEKMTSKTKQKIKIINKQEMKKANDDAECCVEKSDNEYKYYFYSKELARQTKKRRARKVAEQIKAAEALAKKIEGKIPKCKTRKVLNIAELEEQRITTEITVQKRLIAKPLKQIRKQLEAEGSEFDGWFVLSSNKKISPKKALKRYRDKDTVEKIICSLKQNCKLRPFNVRKNECVKGSVFISMLAAFILGCFQWMNKELRNKSHSSILETVKRLTVALKINKFGVITSITALNVTDFLKKIFPQLQT